MNLPNKLTVVRICLIPVFVALYLLEGIPQHYFWALIVFSAASLTDLADGKIARSRGLVTDFGKLMDPLADKLLVMSALICFIPTGIVPVVAVILILAREFLVTSIRLVAAGKGQVLAADKWGKLKTVFQMCWICTSLLWLSLPQLLPDRILSLVTIKVLDWINLVLLILVLLLTVGSGFNYLWKNRSLFADA